MNLKEKKVLITGGSSGIGFAIAEAMLAKGEDVAITGRRQSVVAEPADQLQARLQTVGRSGLSILAKIFRDGFLFSRTKGVHHWRTSRSLEYRNVFHRCGLCGIGNVRRRVSPLKWRNPVTIKKTHRNSYRVRSSLNTRAGRAIMGQPTICGANTERTIRCQ
jgi:hypothetical protein